jgi:chromosome segregation ATPase
MPVKKAPSSKKKPARRDPKPRPSAKSSSGGVSAIASAQLKQLGQSIEQLKARLEKETSARATASNLVAEAKKAHATLMAQVKTLRDEGGRVAKELQRALSDSDKREAARRQAVEKIAELRSELARRTIELKRKSEELAALAKESALRAKDIIMNEATEASSSVGEDTSMPASEPPTTETESVSPETLEREESPRESSIEREIHPERKT